MQFNKFAYSSSVADFTNGLEKSTKSKGAADYENDSNHIDGTLNGDLQNIRNGQTVVPHKQTSRRKKDNQLGNTGCLLSTVFILNPNIPTTIARSPMASY